MRTSCCMGRGCRKVCRVAHANEPGGAIQPGRLVCLGTRWRRRHARRRLHGRQTALQRPCQLGARSSQLFGPWAHAVGSPAAPGRLVALTLLDGLPFACRRSVFACGRFSLPGWRCHSRMTPPLPLYPLLRGLRLRSSGWRRRRRWLQVCAVHRMVGSCCAARLAVLCCPEWLRWSARHGRPHPAADVRGAADAPPHGPRPTRLRTCVERPTPRRTARGPPSRPAPSCSPHGHAARHRRQRRAQEPGRLPILLLRAGHHGPAAGEAPPAPSRAPHDPRMAPTWLRPGLRLALAWQLHGRTWPRPVSA